MLENKLVNWSLPKSSFIKEKHLLQGRKECWVYAEIYITKSRWKDNFLISHLSNYLQTLHSPSFVQFTMYIHLSSKGCTLNSLKNMSMLEDTTLDIQVKYHIFPASLFTCTLFNTAFLPFLHLIKAAKWITRSPIRELSALINL